VRLAAAALLTLGLALPCRAEDVVESRSGVAFPETRDDMRLLGVGLRVKSIAFVKVKVYALGLYVADSALSGSLAAHKGQPPTPALYKDLVWGDFPKQVVLKFTRGLGQSRIQDAMREALVGANPEKLEMFVSYFPEVREGQECVLRWLPGGVLEATMTSQPKLRIEDKEFTAAVFGIWLREKPIQDDIKVELVKRLQ
jgi:hypothetical protein